MLKGLLLVYSLFVFTACQASGTDKTEVVNSIESVLINYLYTLYDDFQITEIYSKKDNKMTFLKSSLGENLLVDSSHTQSKELYFKGVSNQSESHIGIASIIYLNKQAAKNASENLDKNGYFRNTKILTKYIIINVGKENLIVYSESAADKQVTAFMEQLLKINLDELTQ
jgi:hypothetical protein